VTTEYCLHAKVAHHASHVASESGERGQIPASQIHKYRKTIESIFSLKATRPISSLYPRPQTVPFRQTRSQPFSVLSFQSPTRPANFQTHWPSWIAWLSTANYFYLAKGAFTQPGSLGSSDYRLSLVHCRTLRSPIVRHVFLFSSSSSQVAGPTVFVSVCHKACQLNTNIFTFKAFISVLTWLKFLWEAVASLLHPVCLP
jgi:hypothetical protein